MPVFHTRTIEGILEPVAQQVRAALVPVRQYPVGGVRGGGSQLIGPHLGLGLYVWPCVCGPSPCLPPCTVPIAPAGRVCCPNGVPAALVLAGGGQEINQRLLTFFLKS